MKLALILLAISISAHAQEKEAEITSGVYLTLTDTPCTMYDVPNDVMLYQAYGVDETIAQSAEGCYSKENDGTVMINLVNTTNGNQYGYVLNQAIFVDKAE
jgi:hypothetical protein